MAKARSFKNPFVPFTPSQFLYFLSVSPLSSYFFSHKKSPRGYKQNCMPPNFSIFFVSLLTSLTFFGISVLRFIPFSHNSSPCHTPSSSFSLLTSEAPVFTASLFSAGNEDEPPGLSSTSMVPLPVHGVGGNLSKEEREFWKQPDGEGYKPCLHFSIGYRKASARISKEKRRFLVMEASGGLNQQRNQIVDAVVIARILEAALVVPVLKVNLIWGDESEFSDIFDVEHFKTTLQADVRVVPSLPSTHFMSRQSIETKIPYDVSPLWIRTRFFRKLNEQGVLVLKGLDSKLSKNLPPDLQKLRCKVAFHALRFSAPIREIGERLARRMWIEGPYIAVHFRLEKDVWVRTGCLTGLGPKYDNGVTKIRQSQSEYLTGRLNMTNNQRRLAGLCPLNAFELARFLKALGAPRNARIYSAGGEPLGGSQALQPLVAEFPNVLTKEMLAKDGELSPYVNKSSALAAVDYMISLNSDIFIPSHGGNMARAMQGYRAYMGHRKYIKPNKRAMLPFFEDTSISEEVLGSIIKKLHGKSQGQPEPRTNRRDRDVIAYPVSECMCKHTTGIF